MPADFPQKQEYRSPWPESEDLMPKQRTPGRRSLGWIPKAILLLIVLLGAGVYYIYFRGSDRPNLSLEFSKPDQILLGQPFSITVSYSNYSDSILKDAKLTLFLPEGISFVGQSPDQRVVEQAVGDLGPGSLNQQQFNLIVTSGSQTLKRLEARLVYGFGASRSQFENKAEVDLLVSQSAVGFSFEVPESVLNGEDFEIKVRYRNNTNQEFRNLEVKLDYPPIFEFKRGNPAPKQGTPHTWDVPSILPGAEDEIAITGSVLGPEQSFFAINGTLAGDFLGQSYALNSQTASIGIAQAPLSIRMTLNNAGPEYVAGAGEILRYRVSLRNNVDATFQNVNMKLRLIGEMFNIPTVRTNGALNSVTNVISWSPGSEPGLANFGPGEERSFEFEVAAKNDFPIRRLSDKNFILKIQAEADSPTVPAGTAAARTVSLATLETKIRGKAVVDAQALWRDAASGILNSGPYPPVANRGTQYTVHWVVTNFSTDLGGVRVRASLPAGVVFTGNAKSNTGSSPTADEAGVVTWEIPSLPAAKGVIGAPAEAVFQIEATPAVTQVGQTMQILGETRLEAKDLFTETDISAADGFLTTDLPDDKTITETDRRVKL